MLNLEKFQVPAELETDLLGFYHRQTVFSLADLNAERSELSQFFGVYALFYRGEFELYAPISSANSSGFLRPIYVGKAVSEGARTGSSSEMPLKNNNLYKRLHEHRRSIAATQNLHVAEFWCSVVAMDAALVDWAESTLIGKLRPDWNAHISGFGIHDPGKGRYEQARSVWDQLHPGRAWAVKMQNLAVHDLMALRRAIERSSGEA